MKKGKVAMISLALASVLVCTSANTVLAVEQISDNTVESEVESTAETKTLEQLAGPDCHMADVLGMELGEDPVNPEYSYISGNLTPGYSDKVSEVRRSMMFMPTGREDKPAIFVVMDKVIASDPDFKKTFLIHSLQEPEVEGNVTTIKRDTIGYNGKLTMQTLYPKEADITKVGGFGKQFWVVDENIPCS